ncbi:hypothetical protein [Streptomyces iconiensis]|uniref:Uncharacterized protein n=1 Tax=Streptomyces iconiensis TaxID=1384038 RepID=A0ABT7AB67_9ACTN|nr:hypothetical protein [Streptomyces iconiensis]MDJ1138535.1 hypothetical protein [Streptomyces iconiensis]
MTAQAPPRADDAHAAVQRHEMDDPGLEAAFARLAIEHPQRCTPQTEPDSTPDR